LLPDRRDARLPGAERPGSDRRVTSFDPKLTFDFSDGLKPKLMLASAGANSQ
jgi:hypothetical protein